MSSKHVKKLSKKKQKLSLGEVKKAENVKAAANRKVIRSTVVNPCDLEWPSLNEEDEKELLACLTTDLECLRLPNYHVPLKVVKQVERGDRRHYRDIWLTERALEVGFDVAVYTRLRADISLGVNCVSTALEQNLLIAVIIEKDVDPPIITKLLVPLAASKGVPIIAMSGLNQMCLKVFKTRCIAMGLKAKCREIGHAFNQIFHVIQSISEKSLSTVDKEDPMVYMRKTQVRLTTPSSSATEATEAQLMQVTKTSGTEKRKAHASTKSPSPDYFKPPKIRKV